MNYDNEIDTKYKAIRSYCNQSGYDFDRVVKNIKNGIISTTSKFDSYGDEILYINKRDPQSYAVLQECLVDRRDPRQLKRTNNLREKYGEHKDTVGEYLIFVKRFESNRLFKSFVLTKDFRLIHEIESSYPFFQEALLKSVQWVWDYYNNEADRQGDVQYKTTHTQVTLNYYDMRCILMYLPPTADITGKTIERIVRAQKRVNLPQI